MQGKGPSNWQVMELKVQTVRWMAPPTHSVSSGLGWNIRQRGDGNTAFDDTTGEVSGAWVLDRPPAASPGLLIYIMVDSVAATLDLVVANGGEIVQPIGGDAPEITARFRDPGGNVVGLYQERG